MSLWVNLVRVEWNFKPYLLTYLNLPPSLDVEGQMHGGVYPLIPLEHRLWRRVGDWR